MQYSDVVERFLRYVRIDTQSCEDSGTTPSTMKQHDLAKLLVQELEEMGASEIRYDRDRCYVYATVPSTLPEGSMALKDKTAKVPVLGLIAHMDTADAVSGTGVSPRVVKNYDGGDIILNEEKGILLSPKDFPLLLHHVGEDLIVTDGTTLLGADDKAGVAEIMSTAAYLLAHPEIPHGKLRLGFTPDEEIGRGPDGFDIPGFGADFGYTMDGGGLGELEYENFNAATAVVTFHGRSTHPGDAKNKMINASLLACAFESLLPAWETPEHTEGHEGFYHLMSIEGNCEKAESAYIIRDHNRVHFEARKVKLEKAAEWLRDQYGQGAVDITITDSYFNMEEKIRPHMHLIDHAKAAMAAAGVTAVISPIRGGTDGAMLSFKGLPCPNLCTGGHNYHSRYEYASIQEMEKVTEILQKLVDIYAENGYK